MFKRILAPLFSHICFTVSAATFLAGGDNFQSQILKKRKSECLSGLKGFLPHIYTLTYIHTYICYVPCERRFYKIKYGFEGSISNVDLGLF